VRRKQSHDRSSCSSGIKRPRRVMSIQSQSRMEIGHSSNAQSPDFDFDFLPFRTRSGRLKTKLAFAPRFEWSCSSYFGVLASRRFPFFPPPTPQSTSLSLLLSSSSSFFLGFCRSNPGLLGTALVLDTLQAPLILVTEPVRVDAAINHVLIAKPRPSGCAPGSAFALVAVVDDSTVSGRHRAVENANRV